jgi:hypothetical protein
MLTSLTVADAVDRRPIDSVYNPDANRAAISWMLSVGRGREFDAVTEYGC